MELIPEVWFLLCQSMFDTGRELATKLWPLLPEGDKVKWELKVMQNRGKDYRIAADRTRRLSAILTPKMLLEASTRLEPEGTIRSKEIRQFEIAVLTMVDNGDWRKW